MIKGYCDPKFKKVHDTFSNAITSGFETGAALAIEHKGEMIVNLWGGHQDANKTIAWEEDTLINVFKSQNINNDQVISQSEKTIREKVDKREKYDIDVITGGALTKDVLPELLLFPPIVGELTNKMNISAGHFGVDVIAPKNEAVVAILKGTIVYQNWTPTDGHVVHIQHKNNLLSIYKHNSEVLKKIGDYVDAGEPISIVGNSGEHSTGPHLHFELWHNGYPIDPEKFINFQ